jgi:hypothetical protein
MAIETIRPPKQKAKHIQKGIYATNLFLLLLYKIHGYFKPIKPVLNVQESLRGSM